MPGKREGGLVMDIGLQREKLTSLQDRLDQLDVFVENSVSRANRLRSQFLDLADTLSVTSSSSCSLEAGQKDSLHDEQEIELLGHIIAGLLGLRSAICNQATEISTNLTGVLFNASEIISSMRENLISDTNGSEAGGNVILLHQDFSFFSSRQLRERVDEAIAQLDGVLASAANLIALESAVFRQMEWARAKVVSTGR